MMSNTNEVPSFNKASEIIKPAQPRKRVAADITDTPAAVAVLHGCVTQQRSKSTADVHSKGEWTPVTDDYISMTL